MIQVRRLGHATLTTPDIERQIAYYTEVVGLTLIGRGKDRESSRSDAGSVDGLHVRLYGQG